MQLAGNSTHKKVLQLFINLFKQDKNIKAFILFGSLARGNWDDYSDLDLDAVVDDVSREKIQAEKNAMIRALETAKINVLFCFEEFENEFVFILDTLDRISIRFHKLEDTHPAILDSMKIIYGELTPEQIKTSQNPAHLAKTNFELLNDKFLEHSIYVGLSIKRNKFINAAFFINKMRQIIIEIYVKARNKREFDFEEIAEEAIKQKIWQTFLPLSRKDLETSFLSLSQLYLFSIEHISLNRIKLTSSAKEILEKAASY